jgi:hypothetical protein
MKQFLYDFLIKYPKALLTESESTHGVILFSLLIVSVLLGISIQPWVGATVAFISLYGASFSLHKKALKQWPSSELRIDTYDSIATLDKLPFGLNNQGQFVEIEPVNVKFRSSIFIARDEHPTRVKLFINKVLWNREEIASNVDLEVTVKGNSHSKISNPLVLSDSPVEYWMMASIPINFPSEADKLSHLGCLSDLRVILGIEQDGRETRYCDIDCDVSAFHRDIESQLKQVLQRSVNQRSGVIQSDELFSRLKAYWESVGTGAHTN